MNEYLRRIHEQRLAAADESRKKLVKAQETIVRRSKAFVDGTGSYTAAQRSADARAIKEAMAQHTLAIKAILDIEREIPRLDADTTA